MREPLHIQLHVTFKKQRQSRQVIFLNFYRWQIENISWKRTCIKIDKLQCKFWLNIVFDHVVHYLVTGRELERGRIMHRKLGLIGQKLHCIVPDYPFFLSLNYTIDWLVKLKEFMKVFRGFIFFKCIGCTFRSEKFE